MNETVQQETGKKTSVRTRATRARLIASAEQLFAERGVASVSLNEITRAAQQKNRNAVHYHFGSKEALVQAIFENTGNPSAPCAGRCLRNWPSAGPVCGIL